ncbi:MAG: redoxin domain-containing protein [Deltaproteobacteria bacterium]|nr:redoxin domain-containing protein [Deltaproteobacteria bacterium]
MGLLFSLTIGLVVTACSPPPSSPTQKQAWHLSAAHQALTTEAQWLNTSRPLKPEDLAGRILLVDFWTYCCINCLHVMPDLHRLEKEFGPDLTVIGVHSGKFDNERDLENIRAAVLRYEIEHPVVNDAEFKIWNAFGTRAWPTFLLINPEGEVDRAYSGEGHYQELREDILRLRKEYAGKFRSDPLPMALEKEKAPSSLLGFPGKLAYAPDLDRVFVSDSNRHRILGLQPDGTVVTEIGREGEAGARDGSFAEARFRAPQGLLYADRKLYVADTENHLLRVVDLEAGKVNTIAGTGAQAAGAVPPLTGDKREQPLQRQPALQTPLSSPSDLAFYPNKAAIGIAMAGAHQLWSYDLATQTLQVLAGNGSESIDDGAYPDNSLSQPSGLSAFGGKLYFVDSESSSLRELAYVPDYKVLRAKVRTLIGTGLFDFGFKDGKQGAARLQHPLGVWAEDSGIYVADSYNHAIRRYAPATGLLTTLAGNGMRGRDDGSFERARFNEPNAIIRVGEKLYVADTNNHAIRVLDPATKTVSTLELRMPTSAPPARPAEKLPNLKIRERLVLAAGVPIPWSLQLPEGWKLNAEAPSTLRLFELKPEGASLLRAYPRAELLGKQVSLPAVKAGGRYLLQGTFYYCREGKEALCFLQSAEAEVAGAQDGAAAVMWKIDPHSAL